MKPDKAFELTPAYDLSGYAIFKMMSIIERVLRKPHGLSFDLYVNKKLMKHAVAIAYVMQVTIHVEPDYDEYEWHLTGLFCNIKEGSFKHTEYSVWSPGA